jgi:uncharacterized SAM-binding protein YcdF (DUF218 family)
VLFKPLLFVVLLPPMNLVVAILVGLALTRVWPRLGHWLIGLAAVLMLVLSLPVVSDTLLRTLEIGLPVTPPRNNPPGAIVILGGGIERTGDTQPGAIVGGDTLQRLRAGAALQRKTQLPVLVSGGLVIPHEPPVAELMQQSLTEDFQVPVRWVEANSRDTWQNAQDSAAILRAAGIDSIYLVTQAWHERRALMAFSAAGLAATAAPTPLNRRPAPIALDFVPRPSALPDSFSALHEWIGCAWYALRLQISSGPSVVARTAGAAGSSGLRRTR